MYLFTPFYPDITFENQPWSCRSLEGFRLLLVLFRCRSVLQVTFVVSYYVGGFQHYSLKKWIVSVFSATGPCQLPQKIHPKSEAWLASFIQNYPQLGARNLSEKKLSELLLRCFFRRNLFMCFRRWKKTRREASRSRPESRCSHCASHFVEVCEAVFPRNSIKTQLRSYNVYKILFFRIQIKFPLCVYE